MEADKAGREPIGGAATSQLAAPNQRTFDRKLIHISNMYTQPNVQPRAVLLTGLAVLAGCGGGSADATAQDPPSIGATQMLADIAALSADSLEGRLVGSRGNSVAREMIVERFTRLGLRSFGGSFTTSFPLERNGVSLTGVNAVGYIEGGSDPDRYIVITAHYDHLGIRAGEIYNGADDNGSGTAALLALAAYFTEHRPRNSVIFLAVDAEEGGSTGARAFVSSPPPPVSLENIAANVNMDMVSHSEDELYVAGTYHYPFLKPYVDRVGEAAEVTLEFGHDSPDLGDGDWTHASDHAPFHEAGIPFLYFGVEDHADYHKPTDDFDRINQDFYVKAVTAILRVVLELDGDLDLVTLERERR